MSDVLQSLLGWYFRIPFTLRLVLLIAVFLWMLFDVVRSTRFRWCFFFMVGFLVTGLVLFVAAASTASY